MYKEYTAADYRRAYQLAHDYRVDGVLCHGAMRKRRHAQEFRHILRSLGTDVTIERVQASGFLEHVTVLKIGGKTIWFDTVYGGAYLSEFLHIACLLGSRKNILTGSCGGISQAGRAGDLVLPDSSYGNESSTRMYHPENETHLYFPDQALRARLKQRLEPQHKVIEGRLITCQGALAETWEGIEQWSQAGYVGAEMESSTFFAVSSYFQVPSAALLLIADNLISRATFLDDDFAQLKTGLASVKRYMMKTALEELLV